MEQILKDIGGNFQKIQDSEINYKIECFWSGGFTITLGDELNGFGTPFVVDAFAEVEPMLVKMVKHRHPNSKFVCDLEGRPFDKSYWNGKEWVTKEEYETAEKAKHSGGKE